MFCSIRVLRLFIFSCLFVFLLSLSSEAFSSKVLSVSNRGSWVERNGKNFSLNEGMKIYDGDIIKTDSTGYVQVIFPDGTDIALSSLSSIGICKYSYEKENIPVFYSVLHYGFARFSSGKISEKNINGIIIETKDATIIPHGGGVSVQSVPGLKTIVTISELKYNYPVYVKNLYNNKNYYLDLDNISGVEISKNLAQGFQDKLEKYVQQRYDVNKAIAAVNYDSLKECGDFLYVMKKKYNVSTLAYGKDMDNTAVPPVENIPEITSPASPMPIQYPPVDGGPIQLPPIGGGPIQLPPIDGGPIQLPPIDGGPIQLPPIDGSPIPLPPIDGGPVQVPPIDGGPIQLPPIDGGPIQLPPIDGGPIQLPPIDGGPIQLPPIDGGPMPLPPVDGGPIPLPPIDGGPLPVPPIGGGPIQVPPIGGGPIIVPEPPLSASYSGKLVSPGGWVDRGTFNFNVSLSGGTGKISNATFNMSEGSPEVVKAINGSSNINSGSFVIDNFTISETNFPEPVKKVIMDGKISDSTTSGIWKVINADSAGSVRHEGEFSGKK